MKKTTPVPIQDKMGVGGGQKNPRREISEKKNPLQ